MRTKQNVLALLAILTVAISGCQGFSGSGEQGIPDNSEVFEGTEGLVISFFDGAPPDKVFPGSRIQIALLLENKGAAAINCDENVDPVGCGKFLVFSKPPIKISVEDGLIKALDEQNYLLAGKESYLSGGRADLLIDTNGKDMPIIVDTPSQSTSSLIFAAACYPYETKLSTSVCISTAPFTLPEKQRVCNLDDLRFNNQGAPVAIKKIEQSQFIVSEGNKNVVKPHLRIFLDNVGKGIIIDRERLAEACTDDAIDIETDEANINSIIGKVKVELADVSGVELECNKGETFTLSGNSKKDFIECVAKKGTGKTGFFSEEYNNNFIATFNFELSYGYQSAASKEVEIEVINRE